STQGLVEIQLFRMATVSVRVTDASGSPIPDALVSADTTWGKEALRDGSGSIPAALLAPSTMTDLAGCATLPLSLEYDFRLGVTHHDYIPGVSMIRPELDGDTPVEVTLERVLVAGLKLEAPDGQVPSAATVRTAPQDFRLWKKYRGWWEAQDAALRRELSERVGMEGVHWYFAAESSEDPIVNPAAFTVGRQTLSIPYVPAATLSREDVTVVAVVGRPIDGSATLEVQFLDGQGNPIRPTGDWVLKPPQLKLRGAPVAFAMMGAGEAVIGAQPVQGEVGLHRFLAVPRGMDLELYCFMPQWFREALEATGWAAERIPPLGFSEVRRITFTEPSVPVTRLDLQVVDAMDRPITHYWSAVSWPRRGYLSYTGQPVPRTVDRITVRSFGYEDGSADLDLSGKNQLSVMVRLQPSAKGKAKLPF
ncbi:MAG: Ig-like domain-containing protein, partial [Acidobacteria bacterium]|nr:Ig-like domain-containing protein [Acidobacteriota bacterium]